MKNIIAGIAGAMIVFIWGGISWMILPWHNWGSKSFQEEGQAVTLAIKKEALESGIYILPNIKPDMHENKEKEKAWMEKAHQGPFAFMSIKTEGTRGSMGQGLLIQFLIELMVAFIGVWLINKCTYPHHWQKALFVSYAVAAGAFVMNFSDWNWWGFPLTVALVNTIDAAIAWFLGGFIMAKILK